MATILRLPGLHLEPGPLSSALPRWSDQLRALLERGAGADEIVGEGLGELGALVAIGALPTSALSALIGAFGEALQSAPPGRLAWVGPAELQDLPDLLTMVQAELGGGAEVVGLCCDITSQEAIICGEPAAVDLALCRLEEEEFIPARPLPLPLALHGAGLGELAPRLRERLEELPWQRAHGTWWSGTLGAPLDRPEPLQILDILPRLLYEPVQWRGMEQALRLRWGAPVWVG